MVKNYIDNLSEETRKGMTEKAQQDLWPSVTPIGYRNVVDASGQRMLADTAPGDDRRPLDRSRGTHAGVANLPESHQLLAKQ